MPDLVPNPAADWLLAEFDDNDLNYIEVYNPDADEVAGPACVQPMFTLKTDMEPGTGMCITQDDYADHDRWWF